MEYNSQRENLIIPEYGRNVQKLIEFAKTIKNKNRRNVAARNIIQQMKILQYNGNKFLLENERKLWDHLFIISNFELDIDAPFPPPRIKDAINPEKIKYNSQTKIIPFKYYGLIVTDMIIKAKEMKDGEEKYKLILNIANNMKKLYLTWNKETVSDIIILNHLEKLSNGKLKLQNNFYLTASNNLSISKHMHTTSDSKRKRKPYKSHNGKNKKNYS